MCLLSARGKKSQLRPFAKRHGGLLRHVLSETNLVRFAVIFCNMSFMAETFFWEGEHRDLGAGDELSGRRKMPCFCARSPPTMNLVIMLVACLRDAHQYFVGRRSTASYP